MLPKDVRGLVDRMTQDLENEDPVHGRHSPAATIFRVPLSLREVSEQSYDPKYLSFGPYAEVGFKGSSLYSIRLDFLRVFKTITNQEWKVIYPTAVQGNSTQDWVKLYDGLNFGHQADGEVYDVDKTTKLLAWDAIFVVCFLLADHGSHCSSCHSPFLDSLIKEIRKETVAPLVHLIRLDIFKVENQIPFGLIKNVFNMISNISREGTSSRPTGENSLNKFVTNAVSSIYCDLPRPADTKEFRATLETMDFEHCAHLLHCLYEVVCYKPESSPNRNRPQPASAGHNVPNPDAHKEVAGDPHSALEIEVIPQSDGSSHGVQHRKGDADDREPPFSTGGAAAVTNEAEDGAKDFVNRCWIANRLKKVLRSVFQRGQTHHAEHCQNVPTITKLKAANIIVQVGRGNATKWISEVNFRRSSLLEGVLYLPVFGVYDETQTLLRNLLVYEYAVKNERDILSYIHLLNNLINTEEDVKLMMESGVLKNNSLGNDKKLAEMWNTMLSGVVIRLSHQYQLQVFDKISEHCKKKPNKLFGEMKQLYLSKPWHALGLLAATLTVAATIIAMIYTVLTYYYGNKQRPSS